MMAAAKKPPGKGLIEKRQRLLRCLDAHVRYLGTVATMAPWTPPERQERPPRPPDPFPYRADMRGRYYSPREKPELAHPCPGPEALSEEEIKMWVEQDIFVRSGLSAPTQRALTFIATFSPAKERG